MLMFIMLCLMKLDMLMREPSFPKILGHISYVEPFMSQTARSFLRELSYRNY